MIPFILNAITDKCIMIEGKGKLTEKEPRELFGMMKMFHILFRVMVTHL